MLATQRAGPNAVSKDRARDERRARLPGVLTPDPGPVRSGAGGGRGHSGREAAAAARGRGRRRSTGTGPLLDDLAEANRALSAALDSSDAAGSAAYTLEVSTRGISRPLERPAHWRRNRGRLVAVTTTDGASVTGRIIGSDEQTARLDVDGQPQAVALADVSQGAGAGGAQPTGRGGHGGRGGVMDIDISVLRLMEREKDVPFEVLVNAIEEALLSAYERTDGQPRARGSS